MLDGSVYLIMGLVFSGTFCLVLGISSQIEYQRERLRLLGRIQEQERVTTPNAFHKTSAGPFSVTRYVINLMSSLGDRLRPKRETDVSRIQRKLWNAGYRKANAAVLFLGTKTLGAVLLPVSFGVVAFLFSKAVLNLSFILLLILLALVGSFLPDIWLRLKINKRKEALLEGFADAVDLMGVCVDAGMGLDAAVNRVSEEMKLSNKAVSEELKLLNLELRAGRPRADALRNLATRTDIEEVRSLVALLLQTDKFGTSVASALRVHADAIRAMKYQKAEEIALKLPIKMVFPLIIFIFPALLITVLGPAVLQLFRALSR